MSYEEEKIILNKIIHSNIPAINITGGEPMLDPDRCLRLVRYFKENQMNTYLSTNGYNCLKHINDLCSYVDLLGFPLDGYDSKTNALTNGRNESSFDITINLLEYISAFTNYKNVKIGTILNERNADLSIIHSMYELISRYPCIRIWRIYEEIPINFNLPSKIFDNNKSSLKEKAQLLDYISSLKKASHKLRIEYVPRNDRNGIYFIIQPNGTVIVPLDNYKGYRETIICKLLNEDIISILQRWHQQSNITDYISSRYHDIIGGNS